MSEKARSSGWISDLLTAIIFYMKVFYTLFLTVFFLFSTVAAGAAEKDSTLVKDSVKKELRHFWFDGYLKTRFSFDLNQGEQKFDVSYLRLGIGGDINRFLSYRAQASFAGSFMLLDAFIKIKPLKGLELFVGQGGVPFVNFVAITPSIYPFSDLSMYMSSQSFNSRDVGVSVGYSNKIGNMPIAVLAGYYSGCNINRPQWKFIPNMSAKVTIGSNDRWYRLAAKVMKHKMALPDNRYDNVFSWGIDADLNLYGLNVYAEYLNHNDISSRFNTVDYFKMYDPEHIFSEVAEKKEAQTISHFVVYGKYDFRIKNAGVFKKIIPAVRYDAMGFDIIGSGFEFNRLSAGVTFAFAYKRLAPHVRIDYQYGFGDFRDKLILELQVAFN